MDRNYALIKKSLLVLLITVLLTTTFALAQDPNTLAEDTKEGSISTSAARTVDAYTMEDMEVIMDYIELFYYQEVSEQELLEGAYKGLFNALDNHSVYFTPDEFEEFTVSTTGSFGGIGIRISEDGDYIRIIAPIAGTPGERAGLKSGDLIVSVDGVDIAGWSSEQAVSVMRGEPGTEVTLGILREGASEPVDVVIVREIIEINPVEYEMREDNIGYLKIVEFNEHVSEHVDEAMAHFEANGAEGIVIDLRNNPGGSLQEVIEVADYFVPKGEIIVSVDYRTLEDEVYRAKRDNVDLPVAVLINGGSASASEILAGAIQDNGTGVIVGTTSYGKGTVQSLIPMANGGGIKLTIAEYMTPSDTKINGIGIEPDVVVTNMTAEDLKAVENFVPMAEDGIFENGDVGLNIYGAQQRLNFLGYQVSVDGQMGPQTEQAIIKFQEDKGLIVNGLLNYETTTALNTAVLDMYTVGENDLQFEEAVKLVNANKQ